MLMDDKNYKITLANGTVLEKLKLNGNNFISENVVDAAIFKDNCSPVIINNGTNDEIHDNMELIQVTETNGEYWFILRDISKEEMARATYESGIQYIAMKTLSDVDALGIISLFPVWSADSVMYKAGDRVQYENLLYKCLQEHTSQETWTPSASASLWGRIDDPTVEWPKWVQPTGATDSYSKGAKVSHKEKHWISDADNNVWEPGVSGWTEHKES